MKGLNHALIPSCVRSRAKYAALSATCNGELFRTSQVCLRGSKVWFEKYALTVRAHFEKRLQHAVDDNSNGLII